MGQLKWYKNYNNSNNNKIIVLLIIQIIKIKNFHKYKIKTFKMILIIDFIFKKYIITIKNII